VTRVARLLAGVASVTGGTQRATLAGAATTCGLLCALPFWVGRFVPLLDLPQHLALATILHGHYEPGWTLAAYFQPAWGKYTPYWTVYLLLHWLAYLVPIETAARLLLTLIALGLPWATLGLCRALGRSQATALLAAPLVLNTSLYLGFLSYCTAVVVLLFTLTTFEFYVRRTSLPRGLLVAAATTILFFTHVQLVVFLGLAALARAALDRQGRGVRPWILRVVPVAAPLCVALLPWLYLTLAGGSRRDFGSLGDMELRWEPTSARLADLPAHVMGAFQDGSDTWLLAAWAATLAAAFVMGVRNRSSRARRGWQPALFLSLALACYLALPLSIRGQWNIGPRFGLLVALFAVTTVRPLSSRASGAVGSAAVVLCAFCGANAAWHHRQFDREVGPFDRALAAAAPGQRVLGLVYDNRGHVLNHWPYLHFAHYYTVRRGGPVGASFAAAGPMPVGLRQPEALPYLDAWRPSEFRCDSHGTRYDLLLVRQSHPPAPDALSACEFRLLFEEGDWRIYGKSQTGMEPGRSQAHSPTGSPAR
jgi:hypothetical protein